MEISNHSHFSTDAYLLSQRKYQAEHDNVSPLEKIRQNQQGEQSAPDKYKLISGNKIDKETVSGNEQNVVSQQINPFKAMNVGQAYQAKASQNTTYKVTEHNPQIGHQAGQAVATYNTIENSQYNQNLVNRIELLV